MEIKNLASWNCLRLDLVVPKRLLPFRPTPIEICPSIYLILTIPKPIKVTAAQLLDRLRYSQGVADVDPRIHGRGSEGVSQVTLESHCSLSFTALAL